MCPLPYDTSNMSNQAAFICNFLFATRQVPWFAVESPAGSKTRLDGYTYEDSAFIRDFDSLELVLTPEQMKTLYKRIGEVTARLFVAGTPPLSRMYRRHLRHPGNCFELFGIDFQIDKNLNPYVLEVNLSPDLGTFFAKHTPTKEYMLRDLFCLLGVSKNCPAPLRAAAGRGSTASEDLLAETMRGRSRRWRLVYPTAETADLPREPPAGIETRELGDFVKRYPLTNDDKYLGKKS